jgi:DNA-binding transcriptional MerR regulator
MDGGAMTTEGVRSARYPIRAVSRLTGIGTDTLRAWERRYGAVTPARDERGRMYNDADVARLRLLHEAVSAGHGVGRIATLSDEELRRLVHAPRAAPAPATKGRRVSDGARVFQSAIMSLDSVAVDQEFSRLAAALPPLDLVRDVLLPTLRDVGDHWRARRGGIAHEHFLSATLRHLLGSFLRVYARRDARTRLLFTTPSGDRHEIGILGAAMLAASSGFGVCYLGPDLPAREIVAAVKTAGAHVLVLGLTLREDGKAIGRELDALVRTLPAKVELWAGGPGNAAHTDLLTPRGLVLPDLDTFMRQLERLPRAS